MTAVVVTAIFYPKPGKKQELAEAMHRGIAAVHGENGCELYAIHDAEDGTITMIEKWSSVEALDTHGDSDQDPARRCGGPGREAGPGHPHDPHPCRHGGAGTALTSEPVGAWFCPQQRLRRGRRRRRTVIP